MKLAPIAQALGGIYVSYWAWCTCNAQFMEDVSLSYKPMKFDTALRGAFNASKCIKDVLNCYEMIRGDVVCEYYKPKDTLCGYLRTICHDAAEYYDSYSYRFALFEVFCREDWWQQWS